MWQYVTWMGDVYFAALVVAVLLWSGRRKEAEGLSALLVFDLLLNWGLKSVFRVPRPPGIADPAYAFPSGHAQRTAAIAGYLRMPLFFVLAIAVGYSRLVLGVHYWQDVVAGLAIGLVEGYVVWRLWKRMPKGLENRLMPYMTGVGLTFSVVGLGLALLGFPFSYIVGLLVGLATGLALKAEVNQKRARNLFVGLGGFAPLFYLAYTSEGLQSFLFNYLLGLWVSYLSIVVMNNLNTRSI